MKMKLHTTRFWGIIVLSLLAFVTTSTVCKAQAWSREGKREIYGMFQTMGGDKTTGLGINLEIDDSTVYGLGIGYNATDHWNLNTDFLFGSTDLKGTVPGVGSVTIDTDLFLWNVNMDYNFLKDRLTPMVTGGIGFMNFSSGIFDETDFSYNFGAGLRWDVSDNVFLKAMYRWTWTQLEYTDDNLQFDGFAVGLIYSF